MKVIDMHCDTISELRRPSEGRQRLHTGEQPDDRPKKMQAGDYGLRILPCSPAWNGRRKTI